MNIEERMDRLERRQEALIAAVSDLTDVVATTRDTVLEMMKWLQQPPSAELPDLIRALVGSMEALQAQVRDLPAEVTRAAKPGEGR